MLESASDVSTCYFMYLPKVDDIRRNSPQEDTISSEGVSFQLSLYITLPEMTVSNF